MKTVSDIQLFNDFFNEYYRRFVCFAIRYVKDKQIAEDIVSDVFTIFWENREQLLSKSKPQIYILTILKNRCLNHLKHIQICEQVKKEINQHAEWILSLKIRTLEECDPNFLFSDEIQKIIGDTLEKLPTKTRRIFILNRYQGLSYKEIAQEMNLSLKSIEFHISKALSQLRLALKDFILYLIFLILY